MPTQRVEIMLRNSERNTYRRCRQKWEWSYLRGLQAPRQGGALRFGSGIHLALATWYKPGKRRGLHPAKSFAKWCDEHGTFDVYGDDEERMDAKVLGVAMLEGYVDEYGKDAHLEILQPEQTFQVDVLDKRGRYLVTMVGEIDAVARDLHTGRIVLLEHKTAKSVQYVHVNSGYGEQALVYTWAAVLWLRHQGWLGEDEWIDMVLFNFLRKGLRDERPKNAAGQALNKPGKEALVQACEAHGLEVKGTIPTLTDRLASEGVDAALLGDVSKRQPGPLYVRQPFEVSEDNLRTLGKRIRAQAWEMGQVRQGRAPVYKNPTKDCDWDCAFRDVCEIHEMGGDHEGVLDLEFERWNPYAAHELAEERHQ